MDMTATLEGQCHQRTSHRAALTHRKHGPTGGSEKKISTERATKRDNLIISINLAILIPLLQVPFHISTWMFHCFLSSISFSTSLPFRFSFSPPHPSSQLLLIKLTHFYPIVMLRPHFLHKIFLQAGL